MALWPEVHWKTRYTHHILHAELKTWKVAEDMQSCQNGQDDSASVPLLWSLPIALLHLPRFCCAIPAFYF